MLAIANIMGPQTYKDLKAAIPTDSTSTSPSTTPLKAFWCRLCQGEDKPTDEDDLKSSTLGNLKFGDGINCKCKRSLTEMAAEKILKSLPKYEDVKEETPIDTMSPGQQKLDHTCTYKGYRTVFEWDGKQHFTDPKGKFHKSFNYEQERDLFKLEAIRDGKPVRGRRVKFLVRMAYIKNPVNKIQRLLKYFESEVDNLTSEELNDDKVIFICLPKEDEDKYTPRGLPKHESTWDDAL
ncbi:hypothetical protein TrCOL_g10135 [Triparma columacea]|uniref:Uncharacterized protein n=1 Tax=Triparma columacea TaxID=722753 RepID=A0A9W7L3Y0_9STRA|nr:hypothetical protein TrCOL_g10135 [Triparma columacea]